ncbi:rho GTPase-activating protein gacJ isoform X1 [Oncorhynchus kisutch]|uniref:rho GTPase-activating protein gacJ isoform X1 n=2 Tax=Oncorhynchus kisutch TaxID=8019 RepID=UPI0012DE7C77|nr:rho GTPase-activating protein gacJ-like isoform X1 [Oncorhynchus kisutch]
MAQHPERDALDCTAFPHSVSDTVYKQATRVTRKENYTQGLLKMDKMQLTFPCLTVLLGLVLASTTTAQTQPVNPTVTQPTSASNSANKTATPRHTTTVDNNNLTLFAINPNLTDLIFDNVPITNSTGRPNHTVTTPLKTSSDASPGQTSWPSPMDVSTSKPPAEASSTTDSTSATSTTKNRSSAGTAQPKPSARKSPHIGLIIFIVIIITACVLGATCFFTKKTSRRYSVDLRDRHEDLPLSAADHDAVFDNSSTQKGMDTFTAVDLNSTEVLVKGSEGERADSEKISDYPPPASPVDKPDDGAPGDVAPEAPVGETDDENTVSNKTSVESVEANESNNNNTSITARIASTTPRGRAMTSSFSEVPLDNPA